MNRISNSEAILDAMLELTVEKISIYIRNEHSLLLKQISLIQISMIY